GVLPMDMPREVASWILILLQPTAKLLMTFNCGPAASITVPSIGLSVTNVRSPSLPSILRRNTSRGGGNGSVQISTSQTARTLLSATSEIRRETNTLGLDTLLLLV